MQYAPSQLTMHLYTYYILPCQCDKNYILSSLGSRRRKKPRSDWNYLNTSRQVLLLNISISPERSTPIVFNVCAKRATFIAGLASQCFHLSQDKWTTWIWTAGRGIRTISVQKRLQRDRKARRTHGKNMLPYIIDSSLLHGSTSLGRLQNGRKTIFFLSFCTYLHRRSRPTYFILSRDTYAPQNVRAPFAYQIE